MGMIEKDLIRDYYTQDFEGTKDAYLFVKE